MFEKKQIDEANAKSLVDYILKQGFHIKRYGKDYKIEEISGGLYIDIDNNRWHWWGEDKGGGIIQFVMEMENKSWKEAIITLLNLELSHEVKLSLAKKEIETSGKMVLPEKDSSMRNVFAYLTKTRGISSKLVQDYMDKGLLYQSKEKNCVFLGRDEKGDVQYAFLRGTNPQKRFIREQENSKKEISFSIKGENKRLFVFESIIDLMSYQTLLMKYNCKEELRSNFLSLGGVERNALDYFLRYNEIDKITLCLDNDEEGRKGCNRIVEKYGDAFTITRHKPKSKDFNAELTEYLEEENKEMEEKSL